MGDDTEDDLSYTKQPVQELRPETADDVPEEEGVSSANVDKKDVDMDPEDHVNRPQQEGFDPAEREQFQNPPEDVGLKTTDGPHGSDLR